ncbi:MAG: hypothetical protein HKN58_00485 [Xanthomonadales bacterium]|nr:hypothetical protein [Xanthomonadales bacterium]
MSFQEKSCWAMLVIIAGVYGWYFSSVFDQLGSVALGEIAYRGPMLYTVVLLIVLAIVAHILIAVTAPKDADASDERDRSINRYGEYIGGYVLGSGALTALGMAMFELPHFWIANVILAGLVLSEIASLLTRIVLYRRGLVNW